MGNTDSIPVVSQGKSLVQLACGDTEGAARTAENFVKECPGVSQVTSVVQLCTGDVDGAIETQKRCGKGLLNAADGIPVVGHTKGLIHYAVGDVDGGNKAMKSATRSTAVIGGGVGGFIVGGPVGAVAGGIGAGAAMDTTTTVVESAIRDEFTPSGYLAAVTNAVKNPNPGGIYDLAMMPLFDGLSGYSAGQVYHKFNAARAANRLDMIKAAEKKGMSTFEAGKAMEAKAINMWDQLEAKLETSQITEGQYLAEAKNIQQIYQNAKTLQGEAWVQPVKGPPQSTTVAINVPGTAAETEERKEKEHKKKSVKIKVFYVNARSINPRNGEKLKYLKKQLSRANPDVVAIVETWLTNRISEEEIKESLGLSGYHIFREDRTDKKDGRTRRGGGVLIAVKNMFKLRASSLDNFKDEFLALDLEYTFNCSKCAGKSTARCSFGLMYRRKGKHKNGETLSEFNENSEKLWGHVSTFCANAASCDGSVLVGDFNFKIDVTIPTDWNDLFHPVSPATRYLVGMPLYAGYKKFISNRYERGLFESVEGCGYKQKVEDATHSKGSILDLIFSFPPKFVSNIENRGNIAVTSDEQDHCILTFDMNIGKDCSGS